VSGRLASGAASGGWWWAWRGRYATVSAVAHSLELGARAIALVIIGACGSPQPATLVADVAPSGHTPDGATVRLEITGDRIARVAAGDAVTWLWPPIIDSHVHLAYWAVADDLVKSGVEAVVDLAAPEPSLGEAALGRASGLHVLPSGPMLTRDHGYPLTSWGSDGYGVGCHDPASVTAAVDRLVAHGAQVIKLALDDDGLAPALIPVAVAAAHRHKRKVAVHALSDASAALAARAGADLLAHTPVERLTEATVALWRDRAVISTLAAFGGSAEAIDNLRRLRAAGAIVLYGTDLGNARVAGPNPEEVALLRKAGLDDAAITDAMTTAPAHYWGLPFGIAQGAEASFVVLGGDPRRDVGTLLAPRAAWLRGHRVH
jgi:Amidohydrolase family